MAVVSMNNLLESGVHFGHQTKRWNPKMKEYIFTSREGIYIIDLQKTQKLIEQAYNVIKKIASEGGEVLFVGTKKQAQEATVEAAKRVEQFYMTERWLGGTLTNFKTIKQRIKRLDDIEKMEENGTFEVLPKKEVIQLRKEHEKLNKNLCGIRNMKKMPGALFVVDPRKELNAIKEARILGIPVIGIVDTNCDPDDVDYVIPANDDAIRAVKLVLGVMANAVAEAKGETLVDYVTEDPNKVRNRNNRNKNNNRPTRDFRNNDRKPGFKKDYKSDYKSNYKKDYKSNYKKDDKVVTTKTEVKAPVKEVAKPEVKAPVKEVAKTVVKKETVVDYSSMTVAELRDTAKTKGISGISKMKKAELIDALK